MIRIISQNSVLKTLVIVFQLLVLSNQNNDRLYGDDGEYCTKEFNHQDTQGYYW